MFLCSQVILLVKVVLFFHFSKAAPQNLLWKAHLSLEIGRAASWARAAGQVSSLSLVAIDFLWQVLEPSGPEEVLLPTRHLILNKGPDAPRILPNVFKLLGKWVFYLHYLSLPINFPDTQDESNL